MDSETCRSWFLGLILPSFRWGGELKLKTENKAQLVTDMRVSIQLKGIKEWGNTDYFSTTKCHLIFSTYGSKVSPS
jgi:hypothetical protein